VLKMNISTIGKRFSLHGVILTMIFDEFHVDPSEYLSSPDSQVSKPVSPVEGYTVLNFHQERGWSYYESAV